MVLNLLMRTHKHEEVSEKIVNFFRAYNEYKEDQMQRQMKKLDVAK
jgi:hypothetical protein